MNFPAVTSPWVVFLCKGVVILSFIGVGLFFRRLNEKYKRTWKIVFVLICVLVTMLPWMYSELRTNDFLWTFMRKDLSVEERRKEIYEFMYQYASGCQREFSGSCHSQYVSGLGEDLRGVTARNALAYLIYPIDVRDVQKRAVDCLVIFEKENAWRYVPPDYVILKYFDDRNIFAVQKGRLLR